ncbi:MAG: hypothetical protein KatS3mg001_421 [Candidatus Pacearchaeota archaeon]|nr:MAG: hypothetical protein KatS3mg001_421 [Candidatus Pacearchaeota archaeon]
MSKEQKINEMQIIEQNLQNLLLQKQAFQVELSETESAKKEIEKTEGEVFKVVSNIMIKADKNEILEELSNKEKLLNLRIKSIEKQEEALKTKLESLQKEVLEN